MNVYGLTLTYSVLEMPDKVSLMLKLERAKYSEKEN